ncbi:rRNA biogenesis protein rrp36, partial [Nowakowskiella sp. JEL0078]
LSFGKLLDVQQQLGTKKFRETYENAVSLPKKSRNSGNEESEDNSESEPETLFHGKKRGHGWKPSNEEEESKEKGYKKPPKRENKNSPMEITSKRPVGRFRQILNTQKQILGDPRFNNLAGNFNKGLFDQSYKFLNEYKEMEIRKLKESVSMEKDSDRREKLNKSLQKMLSKQQSETVEVRRRNIKNEWRKNQEKEISEGTKQKPYFLKKCKKVYILVTDINVKTPADLKKLELVEKFKDLQKSGTSIEKFLEKRRKKNATKERVFVPDSRKGVESRTSSGSASGHGGRGGGRGGRGGGRGGRGGSRGVNKHGSG